MYIIVTNTPFSKPKAKVCLIRYQAWKDTVRLPVIQ